MKISKQYLKKVILQEIKSSLEQHTGTSFDDVRSGMESEPQPEDFEQDTDGSGVLFRLGDGRYKVLDDRGREHIVDDMDSALQIIKDSYK